MTEQLKKKRINKVISAIIVIIKWAILIYIFSFFYKVCLNFFNPEGDSLKFGLDLVRNHILDALNFFS